MTERRRSGARRAGLVALVAGGLLVALSAYVQMSDPTLDGAAGGLFEPYRGPFVNQLATDITAMGGLVVALTIASIVGVILLLAGHSTLAALLPCGVIGSSLLSPVLKSIFNRERPSMTDSPVFYASGSSFPSGHSMTGTVLMVLLAYVIHRLARGRPRVSAAVFAVATLMIGMIGLSRVFLGVHHPTDVAGGILAGTIWATLCIAVAHRRLQEG